MTNHPNRSRGRPKDPNAKVAVTLRLRPDLFNKLSADPDWRANAEDALTKAFA